MSRLHSKKDIIQVENIHQYLKAFLQIVVVVMGKF